MFDFLKKKKPAVKSDNDYKTEVVRINAELAEQDRLLAIAKAAEEQYEIDHDKAKLISAYESVICRRPPLRSNSRVQKLAKLYIEEGRTKEAMVFLNQCVSKKLLPLRIIRSMQADMYKKDGRYSEAIEFYIASELDNQHGANIHEYQSFVKRIKPCVKKLGFGDHETSEIITILDRHIRRGSVNETALIDEYRAFMRNNSITK